MKTFFMTSAFLISTIFGQQSIEFGYNKPSSIPFDQNFSFHVGGSFLYLYVMEDGLNFAVTFPNGLSKGSQIINMDFNYKPAFQVEASLKNISNAIDLKANYTNLHFSQSRTKNGNLFTLWLHDNNDSFSATSAGAKWNFKLDTVGLEIGRSSYIGKNLVFRPYIGATGNQLNQKYKVNYTVNSRLVTSETKSDSYAIGPRSGLNTSWNLPCKFRISGDVAASILYTRYKISHEENNIQSASATIFRIKNKIRTLRPNFEMATGIGWGGYFTQKNFYFDINASYIFQIMWNQNTMRSFLDGVGFDTASLSHLYLHGLSLKIGLYF